MKKMRLLNAKKLIPHDLYCAISGKLIEQQKSKVQSF